jgi:hypothetical protein
MISVMGSSRHAEPSRIMEVDSSDDDSSEPDSDYQTQQPQQKQEQQQQPQRFQQLQTQRERSWSDESRKTPKEHSRRFSLLDYGEERGYQQPKRTQDAAAPAQLPAKTVRRKYSEESGKFRPAQGKIIKSSIEKGKEVDRTNYERLDNLPG